MESLVCDHYNSNKLTQKIRNALIQAGKDIEQITVNDLAVIDQLHTGGVQSSIALFDAIGITENVHILDAGCGIGGSSRLLAQRFGCRVTGIDLAERFIETAEHLTHLTGLSDNVFFKTGSVLDLPFKDNTFDLVICQHILMNIEEKHTAAAEFFRVLKKGGRLVLHEICKGNSGTVNYPVPWASSSEISFLASWPEMRQNFFQVGFSIVKKANHSSSATQWWQKVKEFSSREKTSPPLNPSLIFGDNARYFGKNMAANFSTGSIELLEVVLKKGYSVVSFF